MKRCWHCFEEYQDWEEACPHCGYREGQPARELYHLFPGTVLKGRYVVGQVLGFGGFGITYKAWDRDLETVVAIKEYYPSGLVNRIPGEQQVLLFAGSRGREYHFGLERFLNEARNMARFNSHKSIVNVWNYFTENNTGYIVMEYLDGLTLGEYLKTNSMDVQSSLDVTRAVCAALKQIHAHGIVHRDVSPDNIFLCLDGRVKLIDFGAARFSANEEQKMTIILKPGYAPPEQYERISAQGPWTDIYALGGTLYTMLTGQKPDESTNRKVEDTLRTPREIKSEISEKLSNAVMKAMALEKHMRFGSVEEFEKAIDGNRKVKTLAQEKRFRKRRRFAGMAAALAAVLLAGGLLGVDYWKEKEEETLPAADIALYYRLSGDQEADGNKEEALESVMASFMDSYPGVTVQAVGISPEDYWEILQTALEDGDAAIFESGFLTSDQIDGVAMDLKDLTASDENRTLCHFMDQIQDCYPEGMRIPFGFTAPVIFCNRTVSDFDGTAVADLDGLADHLGGTHEIAVHADAAELVTAAFGGEALSDSRVSLVNSADGFVSGQYAFYIATSDQYGLIQRALPARYVMAALDTEPVCGWFTDVYSISDGLSRDEEKVALAFVEYMLSDNAQDFCYIRNWTGKLPLNKGVLALIGDIYSDFAGFFSNIEDYRLMAG